VTTVHNVPSLLIISSSASGRSGGTILITLIEIHVLLVQVVANYYGSRQQFDLVAEIHWPGGRTDPPPDVPDCGFDGSGCPPDGKWIRPPSGGLLQPVKFNLHRFSDPLFLMRCRNALTCLLNYVLTY